MVVQELQAARRLVSRRLGTSYATGQAAGVAAAQHGPGAWTCMPCKPNSSARTHDFPFEGDKAAALAALAVAVPYPCSVVTTPPTLDDTHAAVS